MTMTSTNEIDEELLILDQIMGNRHALKLHEEKARAIISELSAQKNRLEESLENAECAMIDFMTSNGVKSSKVGILSITIGESESIDAPDVNAVPDEYIRIKKEVDKAKLKANRPAGNYYTITTKHKLTIRSA